jgi:hypothetical protein
MTRIDQESRPAISQAAMWLALTPITQRPAPLIPVLRHRFGLSAQEACEAVAEMKLIHARAG